MKALRIVIRGRVQGVFFRAWTSERAAALRLRGWVRNRRDGTVEALVAGELPAVSRMLELLNEGPPAAWVTDLEYEEWEGELPPGFEQWPTV